MSTLGSIWRAITQPAPLDPDMAQAMRDSVHTELDTPFEFKDTSVAGLRHVMEQKLAMHGPRAKLQPPRNSLEIESLPSLMVKRATPPPVPRDMLERELRSEFEIWVLQNLESLNTSGVLSHESVLDRRTNGDYLSVAVRGAWLGFRHGRLG